MTCHLSMFVVSTPRLCKALEELYKVALPETQAIEAFILVILDIQ
jgi:hypothetical protein